MAHAFCTLHKIAYNTDYDTNCMQCLLQRIPPQQQLDFDSIAQKPRDAKGVLLDARTLQPVV